MEKLTEIIIRKETQKDIPMIRGILIDAFKSNGSADLVETLRGVHPVSFLVAEHISTGYLAGHILFTPVDLTAVTTPSSSMAWGPWLCCRNVKTGDRFSAGEYRVKDKKAGIHAIVVLGHPDFIRGSVCKSRKHGIQYEYDVPDNLFMAIELKNGQSVRNVRIACYHDAFKNDKKRVTGHEDLGEIADPCDQLQKKS
ncbi:MAG: hypothetical protein R2861_01580 [Desulfobacterales bacterium]